MKLPLVLGCLALTVGCARALKEPPPITEIAGAPGRGAGEQELSAPGAPAPGAVDDLLERAGALFKERGLDTVRRAARLWLEAAAADGARVEGLLGAARALVWITDHDPDPRGREEAATQAVQAAQWCGRIASSPPSCDYWLGAALGVQARERSATALSALPKIEAAFERAAAADPALDDAGPDRALALLYLRAPGWPTGPGDRDKGLRHARKAVALRFDYPPNQLALAEALAAGGDLNGSRVAYRRGLDLARARAGAGDRDAMEWVAEAERGLGGSGPD